MLKLPAFIIGFLAWVCLSGCATVPSNQWLLRSGQHSTMEAVMARNDRIVPLSPTCNTERKPVLLLLHGATDDPTEMFDIARRWTGDYDVRIYSYNYHKSLQRIASDLVGEIRALGDESSQVNGAAQRQPIGLGLTVITYSYSATIFRKAVLLANDPGLFSKTTVIQLVPTAGGSFRARLLKYQMISFLVSWASKPSAAENPYGKLVRQVWGAEGIRQFARSIPSGRVFTLAVEHDSHSVGRSHDPELQKRYWAGVGQNLVTIPQATGATHEYFPSHPAVLQQLGILLGKTPVLATVPRQPLLQQSVRSKWLPEAKRTSRLCL